VNACFLFSQGLFHCSFLMACAMTSCQIGLLTRFLYISFCKSRLMNRAIIPAGSVSVLSCQFDMDFYFFRCMSMFSWNIFWFNFNTNWFAELYNHIYSIFSVDQWNAMVFKILPMVILINFFISSSSRKENRIEV